MADKFMIEAEKFYSDLATLSGKVQNQAVKDGLEAGAAIVEEQAKYNVTAVGAFKTGNLRDSIGASDLKVYSGKGSIRVGPSANYAIYIEYGTYKMAARPYLRPALDNNYKRIEQAIAAAIAKHL